MQVQYTNTYNIISYYEVYFIIYQRIVIYEF